MFIYGNYTTYAKKNNNLAEKIIFLERGAYTIFYNEN
jgi:hypothetical protein